MKMKKRQAPVHPGEILVEEFYKTPGDQPEPPGRPSNIPAQRVNEMRAGPKSRDGEGPCAWPGISRPRRNSGSTSRRTMTWRWPRKRGGWSG